MMLFPTQAITVSLKTISCSWPMKVRLHLSRVRFHKVLRKTIRMTIETSIFLRQKKTTKSVRCANTARRWQLSYHKDQISKLSSKAKKT